MTTPSRKATLPLFLLCATLLAGCAGQQLRARSSVVDYLYPQSGDTRVEPSIPTLNIPLRVGIAFVPEESAQARGSTIWSVARNHGFLTEVKKSELLETVATHFRNLDFVSDIEVIPSAYLTPGGSFANLEQIRTMYGVDVIALVSYDQVQFVDEGMLSLTYWTLVGAYVISGEKNDTNTMLDTVVYDIRSKKMLFRAPGISTVKGSATPVNLSEELRADSLTGFQQATGNIIENLDLQLERFKEKVKQNPQQYKVIPRESRSGNGASSGGVGAIGVAETLLFVLAATTRRLWRKQSTA